MPKKFVLPEGFVLVTSDRPTTTAELLVEIEKAGLRPATAAELEALCGVPDDVSEPHPAQRQRGIHKETFNYDSAGQHHSITSR